MARGCDERMIYIDGIVLIISTVNHLRSLHEQDYIFLTFDLRLAHIFALNYVRRERTRMCVYLTEYSRS